MISATHIPYHKTPLLSPVMRDFIAGNPALQPFYTAFTAGNFIRLLEQKSRFFTPEKRQALQAELFRQYAHLPIHEKVKHHISALTSPRTFTVTTGHQLCLFGGPLYFIYKIISTVKLAQSLQQQYPEYHFVPVFWMASEDHDFAEINHFYIDEQKFLWQKDARGATGRLSTEGLANVLADLKNFTGQSQNANELIDLFEKSYLQHHTLADATRYFVNRLFENDGVVIIDANSKVLKSFFISTMISDILEQQTASVVNNQSQHIKQLYGKTQINAREINFFYLQDQLRERFVQTGNDTFEVLNTNIRFTRQELETEIRKHPEKFSPNVVLRPLYQETILPNLAYIGGGGELAYWLQLKNMFDHYQTPFPLLFLRNSAVWLPKKAVRYLQRLNLSFNDLFLPEQVVLKSVLSEQLPPAFAQYKQQLASVFNSLQEDISAIDSTLTAATKATEARIKKEIEQLEKKTLKALKRKESETVNQVHYLHQIVFPQGVLQERHQNFAAIYREHGNLAIPELQRRFEMPSQGIWVLYE